MHPNRVGQIATWLCVATLIFLSLVPANERPDSGLAKEFEHFIAYAGTALIVMLAYHRPGWTVVGLCLLSSVLELFQNFVAGRDPAVMDAVVSTAGGVVGTGVAALIITFLDKTWPQRRWRDR